MTPEEFGEQFEAMAHKAEDCPVELPPNWGKDSEKLIAAHMAGIKGLNATSISPHALDGWHLFFAE